MKSDAAFRSVWWVRHGESVGNVGERTQEAGGYSLTPRGFTQAAALAGCIPRAPSLLVISPYVRARQTAAPSMQRFPDARVEEWPVHEINFLAPSRCVNTTQFERRHLARDYWAKGDPDSCDGQGAESFSQIVGRAREALARLAASNEEFTVIFSHAVFMRIMHCLALTRRRLIDAEAMRICYEFIRGWDVPNCGVLPMLIASAGELYTGAVQDPTAPETIPASQEQIHLSGL